MKLKFFSLFTASVSLFLLCHCETMDEVSEAEPTTNLSGGAQVSQNVFNQGYQLGTDDRNSGRSEDSSRYEGRYPAGESDAFTMGYEKGFAGTPIDPVPAGSLSPEAQVAQNVYDQGVQLGKDDSSSGLSRNPQRYDGRYPAEESDAFTMGYEKGYNSGL